MCNHTATVLRRAGRSQFIQVSMSLNTLPYYALCSFGFSDLSGLIFSRFQVGKKGEQLTAAWTTLHLNLTIFRTRALFPHIHNPVDAKRKHV